LIAKKTNKKNKLIQSAEKTNSKQISNKFAKQNKQFFKKKETILQKKTNVLALFLIKQIFFFVNFASFF
jgi:preprotein translocase subunit SecG